HMYYPFYFMKGVHYKSLDMNIQESKNKFCNFIYSESCTSGNGIAYRNAFCEELMKFKNVDCLGRVMHNSNDQLLSEREDSDWEKSKIKVQAKYKFSIAFENSLEDGYITEKIIDPLIAGSLPIYFGSEYVKKFINSDSFIYANDFLNRNDGMKDLIDKVKEVEENLNLYKSYFSHTFINEGAVAEKEEELEKFLIEVIEHGIVHDKDPYNFAAKSVIRQVPLHWDITYRLNILLYKTPLLSSLWRKIKHRSLAKTRKGTTTGGKESVGDTPL
ncbi:MAG: glycosyltransferase family 10, partial [Clostridiales bacterium]|nr:glycosyltransferase family 10 [Clostridiales bacterium]